jgi:hypothetical protein
VQSRVPSASPHAYSLKSLYGKVSGAESWEVPVKALM